MSWRRPRAFALRLHVSAAPPRVGLTQALGGTKAFDCFVFQHGEFGGFGWRSSSVGFSLRCFFGQVRLARSHITCLALAGFGNGDLSRSVFRDRHGRCGCIRLKVHGCASGPSRFVFRQVRQGPTCIGVHRHLTIRSSRPHVVASATCYALRLHVSAAPPRVGLTQALGGREAFCKCAVHILNSPVSVGSARRTDYRRVATSSKSAGRAQSSHVRCAYRLRKQCSSAVRSAAPDPLLRIRPAESSRGALRPSSFGFRQVRQAFIAIGIPPA